ncbi:MAG: type II secretion system major pseudopilin GspG [Candidatus Brocadiia bacterium]
MNRESGLTQRSRARRGFTLIELLLVMVILSVLAAVVVPKFTRRSEQARTTAARTDIANLELALDAFEIDTGRFPTSQEGLKALVEEPSGVQDWHGAYIKRGVPEDPWGNPYVYKYPGDRNEDGYDLYSYGPDGQSGGGDDIVNWAQE